MEVHAVARSLRLVGLVALALQVSSCALLNRESGDHIDQFGHAPFYATYRPGPPAGRLGCVAIELDELTWREFPSAETTLEPLLAVLNARMDSLGVCKRLPPNPLLYFEMPDVYAGSDRGFVTPFGPGPNGFYEDQGDSKPEMILYAREPAVGWRNAMAEQMRQQDVDQVLWIRLGISEYPQSSKWLRKRVLLGTDHQEGVRFLTNKHDPVPVVHLTGLLINRDGKIVRSGAEGIVAKPPQPCWPCIIAGMVRHEGDINDPDDVTVTYMEDAELRDAEFTRRKDLLGAPPTWQIALDQMLRQLPAAAR